MTRPEWEKYDKGAVDIEHEMRYWLMMKQKKNKKWGVGVGEFGIHEMAEEEEIVCVSFRIVLRFNRERPPSPPSPPSTQSHLPSSQPRKPPPKAPLSSYTLVRIPSTSMLYLQCAADIKRKNIHPFHAHPTEKKKQKRAPGRAF
ncbi:hypothetical protein DMENIID0001_096740 [Sergentomyia squamirostris]